MAATQNLSIRIAVVDGEKVRRDMESIGEHGKRALEKIKAATAPASKGLLVVNSVSQQFKSGLEGLAAKGGATGNVLSRLGGVGVAAAAGIGALSVAITRGIAEFKEAEASANRLAAALKATEFAAGVTAHEIQELAEHLQKTTLFTDEQVQDAASALIYFGNITDETLKRAITLSLDFAQAFGTDVTTAAQQVGKALQDPAEGIGRLKGKVGDLNTEQKELIQKFLATNDVASAQNVILDKLGRSIGGQAAGQTRGLTGATNALSDAWGELLEQIGETVGEFRIVIGSVNLLTKSVNTLHEVIAPEHKENSLLQNQAKQEALRQARDASLERDRSSLLEIEKSFRNKLKELSQTERDKAIEEAQTTKKRIEALFKDERNTEHASKAKAAVEANLTARLAKIDEEKAKKTLQLAQANQKVIETLEKRAHLESINDPKQEFIQAELDKLNANASDMYRRKVEELAGALYNREQATKQAKEADEAQKQAIEEINREILRTNTSYEVAKQALDSWKEKLINNLGKASAANQQYIEQVEQIYNVKLKEIYDKSLMDSRNWEDGASRALQRYGDEATNAAKNAEELFTSASHKIEDTLTDMISTGEMSFKKLGDLISSIGQDIMRSLIRQNITGPIAAGLSSMMGSMFGGTFHEGGVVGQTNVSQRMLPSYLFMGAPKLHNGLMPDEFPAILQRGETVLTPAQMRALGGKCEAAKIKINIYNNAPQVSAEAKTISNTDGNVELAIIIEKVENYLSRNVSRGQGLAPVLERKYGLNPGAGSYR